MNQPKPRLPLESYSRRIKRNELEQYLDETNDLSTMSKDSKFRSETSKETCRNNLLMYDMENKISRQQKSNRSKNKSTDNNSDHDIQVTDSSEKEDEKDEKSFVEENSKPPKNNRSKMSNISNYCLCALIIVIVSCLFYLIRSQEQTESIHNPTSLLSKSIEDTKAKFYNQELDIWNDISSAINEVMSRNPKIPSVILLFANETTIMNCLAMEVAHVSSAILHTESPLSLNPEHFGNDAGKIIDMINKYSPPKKVVIIYDILNINAEAIKALHNLCDRINPLIKDAIYILTMQTSNYNSSQKKLAFVEEQIYHKLSKSIDRDILMALVTRITDGAIILVQPEPHLRYC